MGKIDRNFFRFRKHDTIGSEDAKLDEEYLNNCYVNNGDLDVLLDTDNLRSIVVGRTGSGKTALLMQIKKDKQKVSWIEPDQLALHYIENSSIIPQLENMNVKLDLFYQLLWRHILVSELIRLKYDISNKDDLVGFKRRIASIFQGKTKKVALDYLLEHGDFFWKPTEHRVHCITEKFEEDINAKIGTDLKLINSTISANAQSSTEDQYELIHRLNEIVKSVQIHEIAKIIDILSDDLFSEHYPNYYIIIDRLDEEWVDEPMRYKLIRALIETIKYLKKFKNVKFIVALRRDLLDRVFRETRDSGFQEEKYQSLILAIKWSNDEILEMLDKRINFLVKKQYTKEIVSWGDIFPEKIDRRTSIKDYIIKRTMLRPRDIIQFGNCCIDKAVNRSEITSQMLKDAEAVYSKQRFRSLGDEWYSDYPNLLDAAEILKRKMNTFLVSEFNEDNIEKICLNLFEEKNIKGKLYSWSEKVLKDEMSLSDFKISLVKMFYEVGLVGLRTTKCTKTSWSFSDDNLLRVSEIHDDTKIEINPMFYRVLGTIFLK